MRVWSSGNAVGPARREGYPWLPICIKIFDMNAVLSPMVSEFDTQEQEASYTQWLRDKYAASLADPRANIPHDQVIAEARALLDQSSSLRAAG